MTRVGAPVIPIETNDSVAVRIAPESMRPLLSDERKRFMSLDIWPGNVRELQNFVAHAALMARSEEIQPEDFPIELVASGDWSASLDRILPDKAQLDETLKSIERHLIARALRQSQGVQAKAAEMLGISRSLLQYKLKTFSPTPDS